MAEIVNLRAARKRKRRADAEASASENRIRHGRSAAERSETARTRGVDAKRLDGHRRTPESESDPDKQLP